MSRIRTAIREFGGALLCDEVGMGKTFVAAAIAREYSSPLVAAPAALDSMWRDALSATGIRADFVSFEKLSRVSANSLSSRCPAVNALARPPFDHRFDLVIVDEAHHARNVATRRHARLRELTRDAHVLLLSATPIHNRRDEMTAVLSLFLGSRAHTLTSAELGRCVLRRSHSQLESRGLIPRVLPLKTLHVADDPHVVSELMSLPNPVPLREGGSGGVLVGRGLVHHWASSEAALYTAVRKRIARAWALIASLEAGTYPAEQELRAWTYDDGALQLGFPELLSPKVGGTNALINSVRLHANALSAFRADHEHQSALDLERGNHLLAIRRSHPHSKIVAFSQYAATVSMLYHRLRTSGGVAILTSHGARVAGGRLSRREVLARFAPDAANALRPPPAEAIELLLTTDLLSEGVNLQDAQIVVHLDVPWTSARMEQRAGRVARMGSPHTEIHTYLIRPPGSADAQLGIERLITRKWDVARRTVGSSAPSPLAKSANDPNGPAKSVSQLTEILRAILESWRPHRWPDSHHDDPESGADFFVAAVESSESGFLAVVMLDEHLHFVVSRSSEMSSDVEFQIAACRLGVGLDIEVDHDEVERARADIRNWAEAESASAIAGISLSRALRRRRLVNRIDRAIESAPPQSRSSWLTIASYAREVAAAQQNAAVEAELAELADSKLADGEWLHAIARIQMDCRSNRSRTANRTPAIHALLLLQCATPSSHT